MDEKYGFAPYNTWSTTTFENAEKLLNGCNFPGIIEKCGVLRSYHTRHGAGPFVSDCDLAIRKGVPEHNSLNDWQGSFRVGYFDAVASKYALDVCENDVDYLAITHMDCAPREVCYGYRSRLNGATFDSLPHPKIANIEELTNRLFAYSPLIDTVPLNEMKNAGHIQAELKVPVRYISNGPACKDKKEVR